MKNPGTLRKANQSVLSLAIFCIVAIATTSCTQGSFSSDLRQGNGSSRNGQEFEKFEVPDDLPVYRKNNLETLSIGRNRIEIEQMMGPPEGRSLDGGNGYLWDYRRPVYDEASDTVYGWSLISFKFLKGLCAYVNIRLENPPALLIKEQTGEEAIQSE